ncbi:MAG TPA: DUF4252 domain-containing protein [Cyclobacteriaceae bacterium]|nr:DUF4252 domain-containing protein [Cyclobacteriaceae bacterium]
MKVKLSYWRHTAARLLGGQINLLQVCLTITIALAMSTASGQSRTTQKLQEQHEDSRAFFFYNNTLRMINQEEDPAFDEAIKDIEKMKLLLIGKGEGFNFQNIVKEYRSEEFEEIMTSRHKGRNFDIFLKEKDGKTTAMLALVNDEENLFVLDIVGRIDPGKMVSLFSVMDEKSDISGKIQNFISRNTDDDSDKEEEERDDEP